MGFEFEVIQHGVKYHLGADIVKCPECDAEIDVQKRRPSPLPDDPEGIKGLIFDCELCGCIFEGRKPKKSK